MQDRLRQLPKVQAVLESELAIQLIQSFGYDDVANAVRSKIQLARDSLLEGQTEPKTDATHHALLSEIHEELRDQRAPSLRPAINATGIIIHTNLGRARLAPEAVDAMRAVAENYSNLELDLQTGKRGSRHQHVEALICQLTGAEAAIVVNNCAAAILSCLTALGAGKPVVASRGEMVEIGGSFRMPDVIAQSGAILREVGTTNKTHLSDYANATCSDTALLLKSHTSNYKVVGFTSTPSRTDLASLARDKGTILVEDLGSGVLIDLSEHGLPNEPVVRDVLDAGVDIVTFSGDKLLGGPQAGLIAGRREHIERIKAHPITRAVRIDKLSLAALAATLELYRTPNNPLNRVPVLQSLAEPAERVCGRAKGLSDALRKDRAIGATVVPSVARAGGGSLPLQDLPSYAVCVTHSSHSPDAIASHLRSASTPVLGRIKNDQFLLDMRSVQDSEIETLAESVIAALRT
ncbi:MAG: L-seryl-tRNA(Sec) selenium transferase [Pseudomonadota bacterium]